MHDFPNPFFDADAPPHPKDAMFFVDKRGDEPCMGVSCMRKECTEKTPQGAWKWQGSKGYGPYLVVCDFCGATIHDPSKVENDSTSVQASGG